MTALLEYLGLGILKIFGGGGGGGGGGGESRFPLDTPGFHTDLSIINEDDC